MTGRARAALRLPRIRVYDPVETACAWTYAVGSAAVLGVLGHLAATQLDHHEPVPRPSVAAPDVPPQD
ncbi:hypothetical protein ACPCTO_36020 [Streptomyces olivoreticuli]